jgi:type VI secretion system protein ImpB
MSSSIHDKLKRVRKPRVHITYEVETEGAVEEKELPFVVGVLGDFSGHPTTKLKPLKDRKFVDIDRDNIDDVMKRMTPGLNLRVENTLKGDGSEMPVQLKFESMEDFEPINVAKQVEPLKKLLATRDKLRDLMTKVDLSEDLETVLEDVLQNTENVGKLASELGIEASGGGSDSGDDSPKGDE